MVRNMLKNTKGFTLIELVVAIGLMVVLGGFVIVSMSVVPQTRMREAAQTIVSEFELTRNYAKTHGGNAMLTLEKVDEGLKIIHSGQSITTEETLIEDRNFTLYYYDTKTKKEYELGKKGPQDVIKKTLQMEFSQTEGSIMGPDLVDYIIISNGSKNYKFIIQQDAGAIYYDYELENDMIGENEIKAKTTVQKPSFVLNGAFTNSVIVLSPDPNGQAIQPEIKYDAKHIKIGGEYRAVHEGTYTITFELKNPYSTTWPDGSTDIITLVWKID